MDAEIHNYYLKYSLRLVCIYYFLFMPYLCLYVCPYFVILVTVINKDNRPLVTGPNPITISLHRYHHGAKLH